MCRLRSCCRQLRNELPMGRFTRHFFERELHLSARPGYVYDSLHFQSLLGSIPTASGPSTLDYRMLVEAVRHLDIDLAMRFLSPTDPAYNLQQAAGEHGPGFVRYVYAWALYVLLFESNVQVNIPGACRLLVALLEHPDLPDAACILLALAYPTTELLLPLVDHAHKLNPTRQYLICLLESGTFPAALPDTVRAQLADPSSATPHLVLAFPSRTFRHIHSRNSLTWSRSE
ncbi:hypothetical protein BCR44DRAFT_1176255 [Catenaria anguillulae PL171]|uniref:Uncharacterized protein n=1 Tax=Catenaria anguillulae PL171 TaxID=765915 RepID=A0A1Y2I3K7_9FUNG|nr:hypothetical protein BCR44DRAFT_1176255 [Catenaria anguillulae PL171]